MSLIKLLTDEMINKIAAGEVIERPASVVKELVENAIDAQSLEIKVEILNAGKRMIRISDNGSGMDRENALMSLNRHATSKIVNDSDLFSIHTMGFRGEALSSISAVSRMRLTTAPKGRVEGVTIEIEGGRVLGVKDKATTGTTIEINDLFFNTPARKKFMKKNSTELFHIVDILTKLSLSNPDRLFSIHTEGSELMHLPIASSIMERLSQIYGGDFIKKIKGFKASDESMKIEGYVSSGDNFRTSRSHQYIFVNKRPIVDNSLRHAVYQAFGAIIPNGRHPVYFLYIEADPATIDINVHPAKSEIRFADKSSVYSLIVNGVKETIGGKNYAEQTMPSNIAMQISEPMASIGASFQGQRPYPSFTPKINNSITSNKAPMINKSYVSPDPAKKFTYTLINHVPNRNYVYVGDVYAAYSASDGLCIVDHHAAHERIIYEKLKDGVGLTEARLLFPLEVKLTIREHGVLKDQIDKIPFIEIEDFGADTFIIRAMPVEFDGADMAKILSDIASSLIDMTTESPVEQIIDMIAKKIACHSSVRGKKILSSTELDRLLKDLDNAKDPHHCPHGRPTRLFFSQNELGKMFKRNT